MAMTFGSVAGAAEPMPSPTREISESASAPQLQFKFSWTYSGSPFQVRLFEAGAGSANYAPGTNGTKASLRALPLGTEITTGQVAVPRGQYRKLFFVVENPSDRQFHFFVSPHEVRPVEKSVGHRIDCLCFGQNYFARPKSVWYRVLGIHAQPGAPVDVFEISHKVVGVDHQRVRSVIEAERGWNGRP